VVVVGGLVVVVGGSVVVVGGLVVECLGFHAVNAVVVPRVLVDA
jgi:hypothetical protein